MNKIFNRIPLPELQPCGEYDCGRNSFMLKYDSTEKVDFDNTCTLLERAGFTLVSNLSLEQNQHRTYSSDITVHIYFCESEKTMRIIADPNTNRYQTVPAIRSGDTTLWQFEVDHSLIDCGMCYIIRCGNGSFFVIDSPHIYSVNDDIRICEFLKKLNGGKKPVVEGWFFSHSHVDHVAKFLDILLYHKDEIDIQAVYYNFPTTNHRDRNHWAESDRIVTDRFERIIDESPQVKNIRLHTGQRFYIDNIEFTVLCTHEDIFPNSIADYNNSSTALMMEVDGCKVLFPGDCSNESDKVLVRRYNEYLKCDVVQMSHHGHSGTSPEFYRRTNAQCALFPITQIKFDEELPRQEANRVAIALAKEYHIASNGTVELPLPYKFGQTKILPDETFEDFNGIYNLWSYEYTDKRKAQLYNEFLRRKSGK
ncbi:MAG: hypothetical protein IJF40_01595 [Clostridia bacterium]|nr:hypothetical protein [Clostridia bacterium]